MIRKIGLILLLTLWSALLFAQGAQLEAKKAPMAAAQRTRDSIERSIHYYTFISFVEDSLQYKVKDTVKFKTRDEEIQCYLDSIFEKRLQPLDEDMNVVKQGVYGRTMLWVRILLFSLAFLLVLTIIYLILRFRGLRDEIVDVVRDSGRIKEWLNNSFEKTTQPTTTKSYDYEIRNLQSENRDLKDRVAALEDAFRNSNVSSGKESNSYSHQQASSRPVETQKLLYADSIIDGVFSHVKEKENDDTVFVLRLKNDNNASITLYKGAYNKVLANASYLEGCEKQILGSNSVEIAREGEAEMLSNGKWKVVIPLKVEIR